MTSPKWWDLALVATVLIVGITVASVNDGIGRWGAWAALATLIVVYVAFGRRLIGAEELNPRPTLAASLSLQTLLALTVAAGSAFEPNVITAQIFIFPLLWVVSLSTKQAVLANIGAAAVIAVGFVIGLREGQDGIVQGIFVGGLSLGFSLALGLWISQIAAYGDERQRLLVDLQAAQGELELLSRDAGATAERERIAREIHDTIAQSLTSVVMLAQRARLEQPTAESTLEMIESTAREALGEARALVAVNAGLPGDDASLGETLHRLAERFRRETGVIVTAHIDAITLPRDLEVVLLRCAQEGLANVRKHANAGAASVTIEQHADAVTLTIEDDGSGLGELRDTIEHGFGLSGMRDRVGLVGGQLRISDAASATSTGTRLEVTIPLVRETSR
ncbi:sensor histidine kinase [Mycetocola manganoxydans]|uniref:Sensor histidine kinase n=1 Tax=Mycetocola manganoxydans TaxID=699879 RepID=A0A3L6ZU95_9MICO|nr:sensor histidine kinase [Mycetocola manganoxydans]RLP71464.1 sensor histidine kinase [Mycetocola manganoxydans]GHD46648.1 two-component sensor histidine kinase [Mycetocola manganoxydans]